VKVTCPKCRTQTNGPDVDHLDCAYKSRCPLIHRHILLIKRGGAGTKMDCPHMRRAKLAAVLEPALKQPVVIETKAGAAGQVGAQFAASAKPDGYTLLVHIVSISGFAEVDKLYGRPIKFTRDDFIPLARLIADPMVLLVNDQQPYKDLAQLVADVPEVRELDINPLLADERGVLALDARVAVAAVVPKFAGRGHPRFAVRPYPSEWEQRVTLPDATEILVRPIRPEDEPLLRDMLTQVTPDDLRLRFFAPVKDFSHVFIARLVQIDYARAMAFVAIGPASGALLGVVRLHADANYESGEYAILLRSDMKGRGLGRKLMDLMIAYACSEGLRRVEGQVLAENAPMLTLCKELGFRIRSDPHEADLRLATLALDEPAH